MKRARKPKTAIPTSDALFTQLVRKQITLDQWAAAMNTHYPLPSKFPRLRTTAEIAPAWAAMKAAEAQHDKLAA